tara:strand:- start:208 stop:1374 length:1167 start_codon:yes stop_codon:yes gene_type:complete
MRKVLDKYALFIPGMLLLTFCLIEWWFYIYTPYSYFYSRGIHEPNVDYIATTYGDLTPQDIFITKQPRDSRYVTDQYGGRNISMPKKTDVIIFGESFGYGAGVGHELTPAAQLFKLTGYSTIVAPEVYGPFKNKNIIERAIYTIRNSDPSEPKVILMLYIDKFLWDWQGGLDVQKMIKDSDIKPSSSKKLKLELWHNDIKEFIFNNSPMTILSRKFKSYIKINLKRALNYLSFYSMDNRKKYYQTESGVIGFRELDANLDISKIKTDAFSQIHDFANAHKFLYEFGLKNNVVVIPLIVPDKSLAYYNEINKTNYYSQFPGVILEEIIKSFSIPVVSVYPEFLDAVQNEFNNNGKPVYWGDDTHWNALGIKISMMKVGEEIKLVIDKNE